MDNQIELKKQFAVELLKHGGDAFKAAFAVIPDTGQAMQIANVWAVDAFVLGEKDRLMNGKDARSLLPSKEKQAKDVYAIASDTQRPTEDRLKAHRLYAELMSFIEKPTQGSAVNILNQGVMVVREKGATSAEWEAAAMAQQRQLIKPVTLEATDVSVN